MSKEEFAAATVSSKDITPSQKTWIDHQQLATQVKRCDDLLRTIQEYINKRIVLAEQVYFIYNSTTFARFKWWMTECLFFMFQTGMKIPRILRLSRKYGFCKHEEDIFLLMTVMQVINIILYFIYLLFYSTIYWHCTELTLLISTVRTIP